MYQKVTIIGNLDKDPELRYTPSGTAVTNFSVATKTSVSKEKTPECPAGWKESYNSKNWELTFWWRVTAWRGLGEMCNQYLSKGRMVYVEGEVSGAAENGSCNPRIWTGNDGVPKASFEITARVVKFLGGRSESSGEQEGPPPGLVEEDSIPF